uniref:Uncharacterized protein n=1 Tax=Picea glauca TaxID=3330 RepID=A0A117NGU6_PICGL|nr:hypothetical protein ABT39_MTgene5545 [Picea glauca]
MGKQQLGQGKLLLMCCAVVGLKLGQLLDHSPVSLFRLLYQAFLDLFWLLAH